MNDHYVYLHSRPDTGAVFYVGKGRKRRAWQERRRGMLWNLVVKKAGSPRVNVIARGLSEREALAEEAALIELFERVIETPLANITDGGKGALRRSATAQEALISSKGFALGVTDADGWSY